MSRLLALPLMAVVIGLLGCGTSAAEALPASSPTSTVEAAPVAPLKLASDSTIVPAMTALSKPTSVPDSTAGPVATALPLPRAASAPTTAPGKAGIIVEQPGIGTDVGQTLPHFGFALFDGAHRNTAQLSSQGRPVFLFFFATW